VSAGFGVLMDRAKRKLDSIMTIRLRSHGYIYFLRGNVLVFSLSLALEVHGHNLRVRERVLFYFYF